MKNSKLIFTLFFLFLSVVSFAAAPNLLNTQKISFVYVGPSKGLSESSFGHVALRLSPTLSPGILDVVVEFVADIPIGESSIKKYVKGIGLGKKYPVFTAISTFYDFKKLKTINEDRPLEVYELNLTPDEVSRVVRFIINFQDHVTEEHYSFFKKNCSYFSTLAIENGLGRSLPHKSLPWKGPKEFKKLNLVTNQWNYPEASSERVRYAKKYLSEGLDGAFPNINWADNFISSLKEMNFSFRLSSYLKLLWVIQNEKKSENDRKKAMALFRYLVSQEDDATAFILKGMFKEPQKKRVLYSQALDLTEQDFSLSSKKSVSHSIIPDKGKLWVSTGWHDRLSSERVAVRFPFNSLIHDQKSGMISFDGKKIGRFVKFKGDPLFIGQKLEYALDFDEEKNMVRTFIYVDTSDQLHEVKKDYQTFKSLSHLAVNNSKDFIGEVGSCYSMTLMEKAFLERAIFLPQVAAHSQMNKVEVIKALLQGNFVVIPGYSNISDFTSSMDKEVFKKLIRDTQKKLNKNWISQIFENVMEREEINKKSFTTFKSLVEEGVLVPMIIAMTYKGTHKVATPYAHAVLVMGIEDIGEGSWRLTAYDPNTNINTLFVMDKDYNLSYPFYDKKYDYKAVLDSLDEYEINLDNAVRSREINFSVIEREARDGLPLIIPPQQITRILN